MAPSLKELRHKIRRDRHLEDLHHRRASVYKRRIAFLQALLAKRVRRRHHLDHEAVLDGTPTFLGLKLFLLDCRANGGWTGVLVSSDRRTKIEPLLHRLGKMSQQELIDAYARGEPGFYPANPINETSHALNSDGVSYPEIPATHALPHWWMLGMDVSEWDGLLAAAKRLGYGLRQPYPGTSEEHHVNMTNSPHAAFIRRRVI